MTKTEIQAVIFKKQYWTPKRAEMWLKEHKMEPIKRVHENKGFYRYRLKDPNIYKDFRTKEMPKYKSIKMVVGIM